MRPSLLKRLERVLKLLLAAAAAVVAWRPGRRARAWRRLGERPPGRVLLVRVDDRVGEALLMTPLLGALADGGHQVHVLVHPRVRRVLEGHPALAGLWDTGHRAAVLRRLRAEPFDVVVNCGNWEVPAVTSALVSRLVAPRAVLVGPGNLPSRWLMDVPVPALPGVRGEVRQRLHLLTPLLGQESAAPLSFRPLPASSGAPPGPYAVINPGGRLGYRRLPPGAFAAAARALREAGLAALITWGPGEEALAREVASLAPGSAVAPPTDLAQLAALMRGARLAVTNNTGPMHLAVAVGCPTLALFLHMEVARWGHGPPHRMLDLTPLRLAGEPLEPAVASAARDFASDPKRV
jgi:ADP-heptose:LPS heptosyltransferase